MQNTWDAEKEKGYKRWFSPEPKAAFLLVHGLGAHAGRWEALADFFRKRGITSYAVELKDFASAGTGQSDSFGSYYRKIMRLREIIAKENPSKKIFAVGESMGALLIFTLAAARPGIFDGLICISPAFANRYTPRFLWVIKMFGTLFYNPAKKMKLPFDSSCCTRDPLYIKKLENDPREYRAASAKVIFGLVLAQFRARFAARRVKAPTLFLTAGEDRIVDPAPTRAIFRLVATQDKKLVDFPEMYHSLSIDLGREKVFEEIAKWAEERIR